MYHLRRAESSGYFPIVSHLLKGVYIASLVLAAMNGVIDTITR
jgi:hypothetical protein